MYKITGTVTLSSGAKMPRVGLGTWQMDDGNEATSAVETALNLCYRLVDTAAVYANETSVGRTMHHDGSK